ncbi:MAG: DUF1109 family protein [Magnetovibrio sp.]|nr:DUF1109 family protein [Magnetovibrio sp.]
MDNAPQNQVLQGESLQSKVLQDQVLQNETSTVDLIAQLSANLKPVHRLPPPGKRLITWVLVALPLSLIAGLLMDGADLELARQRLQDPRALAELFSILVTALCAGYAALSSAQPGRSQKVWVLPIVPFLVWLSLIGESCWRLFEKIGPDSFSFAPHWICYPAVAIMGFAPALGIAALVNRGAITNPTLTVAMGTLAATALGAVGLRLFHEPDATVLLLLWQIIATVTFIAAASAISHFASREI